MPTTGAIKTISLKRSANASPISRPDANGQRSTISTAATTHAAANVRGYTVLPKLSGIQCVAKSSAATIAARSSHQRIASRYTSQIVNDDSAMNGSDARTIVVRVEALRDKNTTGATTTSGTKRLRISHGVYANPRARRNASERTSTSSPVRNP